MTKKNFSNTISNNDAFENAKKISKKRRNESIAQTTSWIVVIVMITFFQKKSIFENDNVKFKLSNEKITNVLIIFHWKKSKILTSTTNQINSSMRKKTTKTKQKNACNVTFWRVKTFKMFNIFNKTFFVIDLRFLKRFSSRTRLMFRMIRFNIEFSNVEKFE